LAADRTFFEAPNGHKRRCGERILTTNDCFDTYTVYCKLQQLEPTSRKPFTGLMAEGIREQFGLGFRKDLLGQDEKYHRGWKGLACHVPDLAGVDADAPVVDLVDVSRN